MLPHQAQLDGKTFGLASSPCLCVPYTIKNPQMWGRWEGNEV